MTIKTNTQARAECAAPSQTAPSLLERMTPAEARRARAIAYEAALAVLG